MTTADGVITETSVFKNEFDFSIELNKCDILQEDSEVFILYK